MSDARKAMKAAVNQAIAPKSSQIIIAVEGLLFLLSMLDLRSRPSGPSRLFRGQAVDEPLLPRFAREASKRSLSDVIGAERRMLDTFSRLALPYVGQVRPQSGYEWLALAQHYSVPTRLLDWTGNPLFALWFAVRKNTKAAYGSFWVLEVQEDHLLPLDTVDDVFDLDQTYVYRPAHITQRIVAQDGWFTVHKYLEKKDKFLPLEKQARFSKHLRKYFIPSREFGPIRDQLRRLGVSDAVLFPDLENLSRELVSRIFPKGS
jgi:hypothetical protein